MSNKSDSSEVGVPPPDVQNLGGSGDASRVEGHSVVVGQPNLTDTERRVGSTSLWQRIVQIFTRRTAPQPAAAPAPSPAAAPAPAARPMVGNPIIIAADPPSPDAAAAGYKTMSVIVGKTPQRVYARNERTLYEIQGILSQPDLLSGDEMGEEQEAMKANFRRLGFDEEMAEKIYTGFHVAIIHETGYVMGNEKQRQEALRNSIERNRAAAGSFQSCQPPDKAKIAGAEALKDLSSLLQTIKTCAARCTGFTLEKTRRNSRKQVIEEILDFCNKSEYQVTSLEWCREGNNANRSDRIYDPLPSGLSPILSSIMGVRTVSVDRLQELAKDHGPELVEQMVKTVYRTRPESRLQLKAAYDAYCDANGKPPIDFDGLLLNDDLRKICNEQKETMELINNDSNLSEDGKRAALEQCQQNMEQKFQTWLSTHKQVEADGSITVDVGHIKIMVSDEEQLKHVTLKSLSCLTVYHQFGPSS